MSATDEFSSEIRSVPAVRIRVLRDVPVRNDGDYVLYWMTAARRLRRNHALDRALELCAETGRPLLILEALRCGYRWASDRFHRFVLDGMRNQQRDCAAFGVSYYPYVEPEEGAGEGLLAELSKHACAIVGDDYPTFFHPRMLASAAGQVHARLEAVDANGVMPMRAEGKAFVRAVDFRRFVQKELPHALTESSRRNPLSDKRGDAVAEVPAGVLERWPAAQESILKGSAQALAALPIDHSVAPARLRGGSRAAQLRLDSFVTERLPRYADGRNDPDDEVASALSASLHFGHIGAHEVLDRVAQAENWTPKQLGPPQGGKRDGWWGMSASAEGFLDQLVTWRELGYRFCALRPDAGTYEALPDWARATLAEHASDPRPHLYSFEDFDQARTHEPLWNAAQNQLRTEGRMHNYLRMLWGKKVLHWSRTPEEAAATLLELNNKYALDGRDPNSLSGIYWIFGLFDRAWGPERPVFGKIRYMSSANTRRKLKLKQYLDRWSSPQPVLPESD